MDNGHSLEQQVLIILKALEGRKYEKTSPVFYKSLEWMAKWPEEVDVTLKNKLLGSMCAAFEVVPAEVFAAIAGNGQPIQLVRRSNESDESEMAAAIPKSGFFADYAAYTAKIESPLSFNVFSAMSVLGCAIGRKCWLDMSAFKIYGANGVLLIGPTGKVKKSIAIDVAKKLLEETATCPILADKTTAEGLGQMLLKSSWLFFCASELSVFLGKQRYNEGLITSVLRLLDYPDTFEVMTQTRGLEVVASPALTILGGSTMSLLNSSTPDEVLSGGFLNRFLPIIENSTDRCFPIPELGRQKKGLLEVVRRVRDAAGRLELDGQAFDYYSEWYRERWRKMQTTTSEDKLAEVSQRMPTHTLRLAMIIHLAGGEGMWVSREDFEAAAKMTAYVDRRLPQIVKTMERSSNSVEVDYVLEVLSRLGGVTDHSTLLRRVSSRLNSKQLKGHVETLEQTGRVKVTKRGSANIYSIAEEVE